MLAVAIVAAACSSRPATGVGLSVHDVEGGTPPPAETLASVEWHDVAAWIARESNAGRPVVLNFFASWCKPCREETPLLLATADAHQEVTFAGVDHLDFRDDGQAFVDEFGVSFQTFHDLTGLTASWVGGRGLPVTAFFDAAGTLVHTTSGPVTRPILDEQLAVLEASIPDG
jgi:thiol-disulfide isomerase/thioredoxin